MADIPFAEVVEGIDKWQKLQEQLKYMVETEVLVGISDATTIREEEETKEVTNAELLFIHTNGSPVNNIPPRPVIEPAIKEDRERLSSMMKKAAQLVFDGNKEEALSQLKRVGMRGQNVSRAWFVNPKNGWPPNSEMVAARKRAKGADNPRPLIDTGELRKSITYFIKTKGGRVK